MFFFEQTFQTVLNGIDAAGGPMGAITNIANALLLLCALFAVYEAYARGGDARMIGIAAAKFLILGLIVSNYSTIFRNVNGAFNQVAATISPNDWANNWMLQVNQYFNGLGNTNWFNLVVSSIVALVSVLVQLVAAVVFPIALLIFTILYCLYGAVLYTVGPMVLALYPAFGVGQLARSYLVNVFVFHAWGIVYALFSVLLTAINAQSLGAMLAANSLGGWFQGATGALLMSLASILFAVMVALIPFLARRIVTGEIGSSMMTVVHTVSTALGAVKGIPIAKK
jgi:hypothetical protein